MDFRELRPKAESSGFVCFVFMLKNKAVKKKSDKFLFLWGVAYVVVYSLIGFAVILLLAWLFNRK